MRGIRLFQIRLWLGLIGWALLCLPAWSISAQELLDPKDAFQFSARLRDAQTIEIVFQVAPGYYLYRDRFQFLTRPQGISLGAPLLPKGEVKFDQTFQKEVEAYRGSLRFTLPIQARAAAFDLVVISQGCADVGVCYPPMESVAKMTPAATMTPSSVSEALPTSPSSTSMERALDTGKIGQIVGLFWLLGLGLSLTPCVYPMAPILSAMLVGGRRRLSALQGFAMALAYSVGMALVFTAMGVAAGLLGEGLAGALQQAWVLGIFAGLLLVLAFSSFGFYELRFPVAWYQRLHEVTQRVPGGTLLGALAMGLASGLLIGPCVTPPLSATLLYIGRSGNAVLGGIALFALALGMCFPLWILGASAGRWLPKAGVWMQTIQRLFGALLVATAFWILNPVLPAWASMLGWGVLALVAATYLSAFDALPEPAPGWRRLVKGFGVLCALLGAALIVGMLSGGRDLWQPLKHLTMWKERVVDAHALRFERVRSNADLDARLGIATTPVILDFYADWCVTCIEMERVTFADPRVVERLSKVTRLQVDVTQNTEQDRALLKRFGLFGPPAILLFNAQGKEVLDTRLIGFEDPHPFLQRLERAWKT